MFVTDGAALHFEEANKTAKVLKDKGIRIVGAATGPRRNAFMPQLKQLASREDYVVKADLDKLNDVIFTTLDPPCGIPDERSQGKYT